MARAKQGPSLRLQGPLRSAANPTSPPETPKPQHRHAYRFSRPLSRDPNIRPVGNGHNFSYQTVLGPDQLSPRSSSSEPAHGRDIQARSLPASSADEEAESGSASDIRSPAPTPACEFVIEDVDPMDSACDCLEVLFPTEIESIGSRLRSSRHRELDRRMMQDLENLNCSNEGSESDDDDDDHEAFLQRRQELRRHRRVSMSSSFGKRTHSELSDSDNDEAGALDVNDVGSSARRMRKRLHRGSMLFHDPPEPRIDELDEPDSSEDDYAAGNSLARELPYYTMEIMKMKSS